MTKNHFLTLAQRAMLMTMLFSANTQCSDQDLTVNSTVIETTVNSFETTTVTNVDCPSCTYIVPANVHVIDGQVLGLQPGSIVGLNAAIPYGNLLFRNIVGAYGNPI